MSYYTFPPWFDLKRALQLGEFIDAAYGQLDAFKAGKTWAPPAGLADVTPFSATEPWAKPIWPPAWPPAPPAAALPFGFVATEGSDVYVIIRGTQTTLEWMDDFTIQPQIFDTAHRDWGNTTVGFGTIYKQIFPQIKAALATIKSGGNSLANIHVTGHSLGAALGHLVSAGIYLDLSVKPEAYTFCGPRAGDPTFQQAYMAAKLPTWRIFNTEDIVPTVPLAAIQVAEPNMGMHPLAGPIAAALPTLVKLFPSPYAHVGYPIAITFHKNVVADNHNLDNALRELERA